MKEGGGRTVTLEEEEEEEEEGGGVGMGLASDAEDGEGFMREQLTRAGLPIGLLKCRARTKIQ